MLTIAAYCWGGRILGICAMTKKPAFLVKSLFWGMVFLIASLLIMAAVSFRGVVVYQSQDLPALEASRGQSLSADQMAANQAAAERHFEQWMQRERQLSSSGQLARFKGGSYYLTWLPWLVFGWFFYRWPLPNLGLALLPALGFCLVGLVWPVEVVLMFLATLIAALVRRLTRRVAPGR